MMRFLFFGILVLQVIVHASASLVDSASVSMPTILGDTEFFNLQESLSIDANFTTLNASESGGGDHKVLVVVAGHATLKLIDPFTDVDHEWSWFLQSFQVAQDFTNIIASHIWAAIKLAESIPNAVLMFSGGQTRDEPISEALSYYLVAKWKKWLNSTAVVLEAHARDSFENLLFAICRFKEMKGFYPTHIYMVGFDFKEERFDLHRAALGIPKTAFTYVGVEPHAQFNKSRAVLGEAATRRSFEADPYGCHDLVLREKRRQRNPFNITVPYAEACPELKELLAWCEPYHFAGSLPWRASVKM